MVLLRWLFLLALLAALVLLLLQATAPNPDARFVRRVRRALGEVLRRGRRLRPEEKALLDEARRLTAALERLDAKARELRRFLAARDLDALARRRMEGRLAEMEAQLESGAALLERLAAELWAREPLDLPATAARLSQTRLGLQKALESPKEKEGVN
ncbi:hypothetical protein [Oceanithermus desulfurans]|uniref:Uncharacterized protein n=2 Tax=Oceanithermus desulfurans TaxID=227924 RepID=A0A511RLU3_9DEIN|nr:hypothetical protein [Oceanithermus desulfurans]MBB6030812.1 putative phage gp36 major capsid-like protein [Oceanithermus desulfurans]GEM90614.1 hypothetical protein ODE01S_20480 [Oceanithermus desulfurans NBRC 100063]